MFTNTNVDAYIKKEKKEQVQEKKVYHLYLSEKTHNMKRHEKLNLDSCIV